MNDKVRADVIAIAKRNQAKQQVSHVFHSILGHGFKINTKCKAQKQVTVHSDPIITRAGSPIVEFKHEEDGANALYIKGSLIEEDKQRQELEDSTAYFAHKKASGLAQEIFSLAFKKSVRPLGGIAIGPLALALHLAEAAKTSLKNHHVNQDFHSVAGTTPKRAFTPEKARGLVLGLTAPVWVPVLLVTTVLALAAAPVFALGACILTLAALIARSIELAIQKGQNAEAPIPPPRGVYQASV